MIALPPREIVTRKFRAIFLRNEVARHDHSGMSAAPRFRMERAPYRIVVRGGALNLRVGHEAVEQLEKADASGCIGETCRRGRVGSARRAGLWNGAGRSAATAAACTQRKHEN